MATSQVDATIPTDNVKVDKALIRANFLTIKDELTLLLKRTSLPWKLANGDMAL